MILCIAFCFFFFSTSPFVYQHDLAPCHPSFTNKIPKSSCVIWESSPRERICSFLIMHLCPRCTQETWISHQFSFVLATLFEWLVGKVGLYIYFLNGGNQSCEEGISSPVLSNSWAWHITKIKKEFLVSSFIYLI